MVLVLVSVGECFVAAGSGTVELGLLQQIQVFPLYLFLLESLGTEGALVTFLHPRRDTLFAIMVV